MRYRNTIILLVIVVALGLYVVLFERGPSPNEKTAFATPIAQATILSFAVPDARSIAVRDLQDGRETLLTYSEDGLWHIAAPFEDEADQSQVLRFVETLSSLEAQRELTGTVGSPSDYGLDPPARQVEIVLSDGLAPALNLGERAPAGSGYYAQVSGDERIYLVALYIGADVDRYLTTPPVKPTPIATQMPTALPAAGVEEPTAAQ